MVWGMVSVTTKEIVPPSNKPKTVSPFRLLSFSFFTLNNKRVKLTKAAGRVHCFLRAPEEFPQHHLVTGPSCLFSRFRSYSSISGSRRNKEKRQWTLQERGQLLMILREEWLSHRLLMLWLFVLWRKQVWTYQVKEGTKDSLWLRLFRWSNQINKQKINLYCMSSLSHCVSRFSRMNPTGMISSHQNLFPVVA